MLLGNFNQFNKNPGRSIGGPSNPTLWFKAATTMNFYTPSNYTTSQISQASFPNGNRPPYSWILAPKGGGMVLRTSGSGSINTNVRLKGNKAVGATLTGSGTIASASLGLVKGMIGALTGQGSLSASLAGIAAMTADLEGEGTLTANMSAVGELIAHLNGSGDLVAELRAIGFMIANITPFTPLSPESLAGSLWNSIATQYNTPGTMGNKLNSAGSAGDPWTTALPGSYVDGSAGKILGDSKPGLTLGQFIALK